MNGLSWFLYIVDVSQAIGVILWLSFSALVVAIIAAWIRGSFLRDIESRYKGDETWNKGYLMQWNSFKLLIPMIIFATLACFIPSRETLYMIAASQIGEQVVALEQVQELGGDVGGLASDTIKLLRQQIQSQITVPTTK